MVINRQIVLAAAGITALGIVSAWSKGKGITRIAIGGYLLALFLSVADMFGGNISTIAGGIAMLALVAAFIAEGLPLLGLANKATGQSSTQSGGGSSGGGGSGVR